MAEPAAEDLTVAPERLQDLVAALRRYDARIKGLGRPLGAGVTDTGAVSRPSPRKLADWHWHREMVLPAALGSLPAPLFDDPAVRLALSEPPLMLAGLVARALYARRSTVRRCIDRTVLTQLRVALGDGAAGRERLDRLQRLAGVEGDMPLPAMLTPMYLAHDGLSRLRRESPAMRPVVVHFVLMQLDGAPTRIDTNPDKGDGLPDARGACVVSSESASFFERLPYLIPELS